MSYYGWAPYVPVAARRKKAEKEAQAAAKRGTRYEPVLIAGAAIAKTFWGKAWCRNLERYSDFANRLPRGRTYVRNGSVIHLEIGRGQVKAKVSGSDLYTVTIGIKPLAASAWAELKRRSAGGIRSLLDLLGGRLSDGLMSVVTDPDGGLFPKPKEISMECSCPDWATMCKHVAAVLYGVGARLDERPELLFVLRGVNHEELVSANVEEAVQAAVQKGGGRRLAATDIADVFGIEMDEAEARRGSHAGAIGRRAGRANSGGDAPIVESGEDGDSFSKPLPRFVTGARVRRLRERLGLNGRDFAALLGVSGGAVSAWERRSGALDLQERSRKALEAAWAKAAPGKKRGNKAAASKGSVVKQDRAAAPRSGKKTSRA